MIISVKTAPRPYIETIENIEVLILKIDLSPLIISKRLHRKYQTSQHIEAQSLKFFIKPALMHMHAGYRIYAFF